jgi:hypothetical protein
VVTEENDFDFAQCVEHEHSANNANAGASPSENRKLAGLKKAG